MVPPEALGKIIGPKGKTVQTMIETYGLVNINLEDTGSVQVESFSHEKNAEVMEIILKLVEESKSGAGGRGDRRDGGDSREKKEKVELGPPPEVGIIYRWVSSLVEITYKNSNGLKITQIPNSLPWCCAKEVVI